ncbi:MAG: transporter substrate-binding domain-containing protein [Rhodospirillales bacterium]
MKIRNWHYSILKLDNIRRILGAPVLITVLSWMLVGNVAAQPSSLTIVYPNEKNAFHDAASEIVCQAYQEMGIKIKYKSFPAERALLLSNKGAADGELVRIKGIDAKYTNLIRIPVSHVTAEQMAFAKKPGIKISGWLSLRPYRIVFHRGYKVAERKTKKLNRFIVSNDQAAFKMVSKGRMDVAIANRFSGLDTIKKLKLGSIIMLTPPIQSDPLYHYLHVKHRALVDRVTAIFKRMKANGAMDRILAEHKVPRPVVK